MPRRRPGAAAVVFALLAVATLAAFAFAQRAKRDPQIIDHVEIGTKKSNAFVPEGRCAQRRIKLKFRTTTSNDATVEIIRPGGEAVRVIAADKFLKRYSYHSFYWDGTNGKDAVQPPGRYRIRVVLHDEGRSAVLPGTIRLHGPPASQSGQSVKCFRKKGSG